MIFYDEEHEELFNKLCKKMPYLDGYHLSLAYLLTMFWQFCVQFLGYIIDSLEKCQAILKIYKEKLHWIEEDK